MRLPLSIIEVFTEPKLGFKGNTAAVINLDREMDAGQMQSIATDLQQPATTFLWPAAASNEYHVRWFAPDSEIELCGHGTLAAIAFLRRKETLTLHYSKGTLEGNCTSGYRAGFTIAPIPVKGSEAIPEAVERGLGIPVQAYFTTDNKHIIQVESEELVRSMKPDFAELRKSPVFGYSVTAPGDTVDFVSRTLVPHVQQLEDHATGSSHAALVPFWANKLGKLKLDAWQLSPRGGLFHCEYKENSVRLNGMFNTLVEGYFYL